MKGWRVPISTQHPTRKWVSHYINISKRTDTMVPTACGKKINPGFASKERKSTTRCKLCLKNTT